MYRDIVEFAVLVGGVAPIVAVLVALVSARLTPKGRKLKSALLATATFAIVLAFGLFLDVQLRRLF